MGYFAAFLICHFGFRHRFVSTGSVFLDRARNVILYSGIIGWSAAVAFSRQVQISVIYQGTQKLTRRAQLPLNLSLGEASPLGSRHRSHFWGRILHLRRTRTYNAAKLSSRSCSNDLAAQPPITMAPAP